MKLTLIIFLLFSFPIASFAQVKQVRVGKHSFTIQWISYNKTNPGSVMIKSLGSGKYSIEGNQQYLPDTDYVNIKGTFHIAKGRFFYFDGKIVSKVSYINKGQPCERAGLAVFKASGKRQYWRLQQMLNCDGISTDYIDIFF